MAGIELYAVSRLSCRAWPVMRLRQDCLSQPIWLLEGSGENIDTAITVELLSYSPSCLSDNTCRVAFVDHHKGIILTCRVAPFGHARINSCLPIPAHFRSLPRPSSPPEAKASSVRSYPLSLCESFATSDAPSRTRPVSKI